MLSRLNGTGPAGALVSRAVVLLGDAGYCPTPLPGLGSSLARLGAYVLAGELAASLENTAVVADDVAIQGAAFMRYQSLIRPYVEDARKLPPGGVDGHAP